MALQVTPLTFLETVLSLSGSYSISAPLFSNVPATCRNFIYPLGLSSTALHLGWLWFFVIVVSICYKDVTTSLMRMYTDVLDTTLEKLDFPYNTISSFLFSVFSYLGQ